MNLKFSSRVIGAIGAFLAAAIRGYAADATTAIALPPLPSPVIVKLSAEQIAAFRDYLVQEQKQMGLPGMAVVLAQPGQTLLSEGLGVRQAGGNLPVTTDTRFALGPATQAVNSLLMARLAEEDIISLDAPATRCWDEFRLAGSETKVTLPNSPGVTAGDSPERSDK